MDSKEFSKGRPGFDLMAMGKEAKESGLWSPEMLFTSHLLWRSSVLPALR